MDVENFLSCRLTVGQEEIDPLTIEPALVESDGNLLGGTEHVATSIFGQIDQARNVIFRHHQDMTGVHGLDIHKRHAAPVAEDRARRQPARKYLAEYTIVHTAIMAR
jgi:RecJ-like exonuclease